MRSEVGVVAADGAVFRGTLADNICYRRSDAAEDEVRAAAIAAGLANTLERLPDGLDTEVGECGVGLSVGERQRVQLARVLLADPRVLILDEATANLDYATELDVKRTLAELRRDRTTIVIAHRYSMVKDADWILVLEEGQLVESGTPAQLISSGGWFAHSPKERDRKRRKSKLNVRAKRIPLRLTQRIVFRLHPMLKPGAVRLTLLGVGAMKSPRYAPAGLLVEYGGSRVMIDGGPGAITKSSVSAWLVTDARSELIKEICKLAQLKGLDPEVATYRSDALTVEPRAMIHTSHPTCGYLIRVAGEKIGQVAGGQLCAPRHGLD